MMTRDRRKTTAAAVAILASAMCLVARAEETSGVLPAPLPARGTAARSEAPPVPRADDVAPAAARRHLSRDVAPSEAALESASDNAGDADASRPRGSDRLLFANDGEGYEGGRGLITLEGISGLYLNPTSGTLPAGSLTAQYCVGILERNDDTDYQHTAFLSYGLTDWFEIGALGRITNPAEGSNVGGGGPLARLRVLKDEDWLPEVSVGGLLREGNERIDKRTAFAAASKRVRFEENSVCLLSMRLHGGFRYIWQNSDVNEANGAIVYGGIEFELPYDFWLSGEISNNTDVFAHQPYAFGVQWRPTQVVGLSVAGVQTGGEDQVSLYVGIGATLAF